MDTGCNCREQEGVQDRRRWGTIVINSRNGGELDDDDDDEYPHSGAWHLTTQYYFTIDTLPLRLIAN